MYRDTSSNFLLRSGDNKNVCLQTTKSQPETCNDIAYSGPGGATRAEAGPLSATASHRGGRAPDRSHPQADWQVFFRGCHNRDL